MFEVDPAHAKLDLFSSKMTMDVWKNKYRWQDEKHPFGTFGRVAKAIFPDTISLYTDARRAMGAGLWLPGGRIFAGAGTAKRVTLMNCFAGHTRITTRNGTIAIGLLTGKQTQVLTREGWQDADIRCFGFQRTNKVTLSPSRSKYRRKVVSVTADHRWILASGEETTSLRVNDSLASCGATVDKTSSSYRDGLFHGIIFGDGQLHRITQREVSGGYPLGTFHHVLRACGRVTEYYSLLNEYTGTNYKTPPAADGDRIYYHHGADNLKTFPSVQQQVNGDYIAGFIDGWWIADGHYENGETQRCISSTNYEHLDWLIEHAQLGGYIVTGDKVIGKKVTNLGIAKDPCRALTIKPAKDVVWTVESIEPDRLHSVYCAVVPSTHAFCLSEGLYTGNCYVNECIEDSMEGIMHGLSNTALTLQQGGGIGTDFSTLRPEGALLTRTHTKASGPIPFMHTWDATSRTIRSAGDRRGAMMGTMCDTHPDLLSFIKAKQTPGALTQFNVSILVSDALMSAVKDDAEWLLYFPVPPMNRDDGLSVHDFVDEEGTRQYVYKAMPARQLWEEITRATYEYSEPGVIFIDRVNEANNLWYCEDIRCTNPCGEQPLPPHGTCNLGHVNLARVVKKPFSEDGYIDFDLIKETVQIGTRFLDAVIDASSYPLEAQAHEERTKRRLGLGFTGLADMLSQLRVRYGSREAIKLTEEVTRMICVTAYETSIELAKEKGSFDAYTPEYLTGSNFAATMLPEYIREGIKEHGIRNSLLLTVAPTGTGSIFYGNVSSGGEPVFLHSSQRKVLKPSDGFKDEWEEYVEWGYGARLYHSIFGADKDLPGYMVTAEDLTVEEHVTMQAAAQRWIDASMSKTINVPKDYPYDSFAKVYELAYSLGCKGCTTYRPSDVRGSILSRPDQPGKVNKPNDELAIRPDILRGATYKIKWPSLQSAMYLTLNECGEAPFELFISSKDSRYHDWTTALTTMISSIFRRGGDISYVAKELQQVQALNDGAFREGKHHPSLVAYIGYKLEQHIEGSQAIAEHKASPIVPGVVGDKCPRCHQFTLVRQEGCKTCLTCSYTACG